MTVGASTGGNSVSFTGTAGDRTLIGVAAGTISAASTDAVNGSQIFASNQQIASALSGGSTVGPNGLITAPSYIIGGSTYTNLGSTLGAVDSDLASLNNSITNLSNGSVGLVLQVGGAPGTGAVTVAAATGGTLVDVTGTAGKRTVTGLLDGSLSATSADGVNGGQINRLGTSIASNFGGGSAFNPLTGLVSAPVIIVGGTSYGNITSAIQAADTRTTTITSGLAAAIGGGASVAPDGTVTPPSYSVQGATYSSVGAALGATNNSLTTLSSNVAALTSGPIAITAGPGGQIAIAAGGGGTSVSFAGTAGDRVLTGVGAGAVNATSNDAVNGGQLFAVQQSVANSNAANAATTNAIGQSTAAALGGGATYNAATGQTSAPSFTVAGHAYDNVGSAIAATNRAGVQYVADAAGNPTNVVRLNGIGNGQPVAITNVAAGAVSATSRDAVNGAQLFAVQQVADGALQYDKNTDGSTNRATVTLGTPGTPVQLRNLAPAVASTDAVNLGQLQSSLAGTLGDARAYTDTAINGLAFDLSKVAKQAYAGTASALALQSPALFEPGQTSIRGGVGYYRGEWALGLGLRATGDNGRWSLSGGISAGPTSGVAASAGIDFVLGN